MAVLPQRKRRGKRSDNCLISYDLAHFVNVVHHRRHENTNFIDYLNKLTVKTYVWRWKSSLFIVATYHSLAWLLKQTKFVTINRVITSRAKNNLFITQNMHFIHISINPEDELLFMGYGNS